MCVEVLEQYLMMQVQGNLIMTFLEMLHCLVLIIVHYLMLIIARIIFQCQLVEGPTDEINDSIGAAEKTFSIKTKFRLSFAIVIIVVILFIGTKSNLKKSKSRKSSLKQITKMSTFQANFAQEAYLKSWMLFNLKQNLLEEVCIIFQLITMLLINLTY